MKRVLSRNGSPKPMFDTNEPERSCFVTEITIHPNFIDSEHFDKLNVTNSGSSIGGQVDDLTDRQKEIFEYIIENPKIYPNHLAFREI